MQFTNSTFKSSFARFRKSLKDKELELNLSSAQDVWAEIVLGKKFSAASASLNRHGSLLAVEISWEKISKLLKARSRLIDASTAYTLFVYAVGEDLREISGTMYEVANIVSKVKGACVISSTSDALGLGILRTGQPGYVPVSTLGMKEKSDGEFAWLRENSEIVVEIINSAAGIGTEQFVDIFASAGREADKKSDSAFSQFFSGHIDETASAIFDVMFEAFDVGGDDDFDFDEVREEIVAVFDELGQDKEWVSSTCSVAEALIDHLTARVRETLKWLSYPDDGKRTDNSMKHSIEEAVRFAMKKFFLTMPDAERTTPR